MFDLFLLFCSNILFDFNNNIQMFVDSFCGFNQALRIFIIFNKKSCKLFCKSHKCNIILVIVLRILSSRQNCRCSVICVVM